MWVPYLAMSIDSDQRKRRGAPETLPVSHFDKFLTTPKKAKTSDDGFDNLEVDQIGKRVSKLDFLVTSQYH